MYFQSSLMNSSINLDCQIILKNNGWILFENSLIMLHSGWIFIKIVILMKAISLSDVNSHLISVRSLCRLILNRHRPNAQAYIQLLIFCSSLFYEQVSIFLITMEASFLQKQFNCLKQPTKKGTFKEPASKMWKKIKFLARSRPKKICS